MSESKEAPQGVQGNDVHMEDSTHDVNDVGEGPEMATRGGVNGSQSKFLTGTWPISQNQPEPSLF
jgi:hypothetical protein